jgi:HPt (histidine-containing phosphotransfer) domain-containing protein
MNLNALIAPAVQDREALEEFADALQDRAMELAQGISNLRKTPGDRALIADIFRVVHTIKGDAALSKVDVGVALTHPVETLLSRLRSGELQLTDLMAEIVLLTIDRLELAVEALLRHNTLEKLNLAQLAEGLEKASQAAEPEIGPICCAIIKDVTGYPPVIVHIAEQKTETRAAPDEAVAGDLQFFRSLALQLETHSPLFKGRTTRILRLALETNRVVNDRIDPVQLEAAIYLHDLGMLLLPERIWLKIGHLTAEDRLALRAHPSYGAGLLRRMPGWTAAAQMVAQHHEMPNGRGYPASLKSGEICDGAKVIAIVDAFEAIMLKHSQHGKNISILRAIAEINACDNQFAPEWIEPFNTVIRRTVETPRDARS